MDNNNTTTPYSTANQDDLKMEIISLMNKIKNYVDMSSSKVEVQNQPPTKAVATTISVLKIHEFKLRESLEWLEEMDDDEWIEHKSDLLRNFEAAYKAFHPEVVR